MRGRNVIAGAACARARARHDAEKILKDKKRCHAEAETKRSPHGRSTATAATRALLLSFTLHRYTKNRKPKTDHADISSSSMPIVVAKDFYRFSLLRTSNRGLLLKTYLFIYLGPTTTCLSRWLVAAIDRAIHACLFHSHTPCYKRKRGRTDDEEIEDSDSGDGDSGAPTKADSCFSLLCGFCRDLRRQ